MWPRIHNQPKTFRLADHALLYIPFELILYFIYSVIYLNTHVRGTAASKESSSSSSSSPDWGWGESLTEKFYMMDTYNTDGWNKENDNYL